MPHQDEEKENKARIMVPAFVVKKLAEEDYDWKDYYKGVANGKPYHSFTKHIGEKEEPQRKQKKKGKKKGKQDVEKEEKMQGIEKNCFQNLLFDSLSLNSEHGSRGIAWKYKTLPERREKPGIGDPFTVLSIYTKDLEVKQNIIYGPDGRAIATVDFEDHQSGFGHWHSLETAGEFPREDGPEDHSFPHESCPWVWLVISALTMDETNNDGRPLTVVHNDKLEYELREFAFKADHDESSQNYHYHLKQEQQKAMQQKAPEKDAGLENDDGAPASRNRYNQNQQAGGVSGFQQQGAAEIEENKPMEELNRALADCCQAYRAMDGKNQKNRRQTQSLATKERALKETLEKIIKNEDIQNNLIVLCKKTYDNKESDEYGTQLKVLQKLARGNNQFHQIMDTARKLNNSAESRLSPGSKI